VAYLLARSLQPVPIFEIFTQQDGLDLPSMEEQREERVLHIEDALRPPDLPIVSGEDSIGAASALMAKATSPAFLVRLRGGSWYAMRRDELASAAVSLTSDAPVERALKPDRTPLLFPDLPLDSTLACFARWPILPVLNRANKNKLEGVITLEDVLHRYQDF
jgi:chloride channel protein, CIC family